MADEQEDEAITVDLVGDGEQDKSTETAAVEDLASQFKELQGNLEREKQAREASDRRADEERRRADHAHREATSARVEVLDRSYESFETSIAAAQSDATAAEQAYAAALEAGNFQEAAKIQRRIAAAETKIQRFEEAKADIEARRGAQPRQETRPTQQDPIEAFIESRSEPSKQWLRKPEHREFLTDQRKNYKLTAAHNNAMAEGIAPDTPQYFESIETFLGLREQSAPSNGAQQQARPNSRKAVAPPAAPVSGSGGGMSSASTGATVKLSKTEAQAAVDGTLVWNYDDPSGQKKFRKGDPIGVQEFARRKLALQQQGAYDRSYVDQ